MKHNLFYLLLIICHFIYSQEGVFDGTNYNVIKKNPDAYHLLALKNNVYKELTGIESEFINVKRIILTDVNNLMLPESFSNYPKLEELIITNSTKINLTENFKKISRIKNLNSLELTNCDVSCIPKDIILLNRTPINKISLSNNNIKLMPSNINKLRVKSFDLSGNPLKLKSFTRLSTNNNIEEIYLDYCDLKTFPLHLGQMKNLKLLSLTFNNIEEVGLSYNGFIRLELLSLTGNPLKMVGIDFVDNDENLIIDFIK